MSINETPLGQAVMLLQKSAQGLSVLYVEDDPYIREEYAHFLQKFFQEVAVCNNGNEGIAAVSKKKYDLVISDIEMPSMNGLEMVAKIKQLYSNQKVIFTSAHKDTDMLYRSIDLQVDGYLFKPLDRTITIELLHKVTSMIQLEKESHAHKENLEKLVFEKTQELVHSFTIDKTTQLYSLAQFQKMNTTHRGKSYAIVKIRKFKSINDFYGYEAGDSILRQTADYLRKELQEKYQYDTIELYHVSGSHFVITSDASAQRLYEYVNEIVHFFEITKMDIGEDVLLLEMDGAVLNHSVYPSLSNLDKALRNAEMSNSVILYTKDQKGEMNFKKRLQCKNSLIRAYQENRLVNYYQPIVDNTNGTISKYEALVRLISDEGDVIAPGIFLPIAKETKMYAMITRHVVESAFKDFYASECSVSINLSLEDIKNNEIRDFIHLNLSKFPQPHRIVFEILESDEIDSYIILQEFIEEMQALGSKVAIDDFGSGYSNFEHLVKLNADYIKIDGSLIKDIDTNNSSKVIVRMLRDFALQMNIKTIAEFVSREEISTYVRSIGIDESQGYYFSEPVPFHNSMNTIRKISAN